MADYKITKVIDENKILLIGKHKGRDVQDVLKTDPSYIYWMSRQPWAVEDQPLMEIIRNVKDPGMTWGKHKGKTLAWILLNDEGYIHWLKKSEFVQTKCKALKAKLDRINI